MKLKEQQQYKKQFLYKVSVRSKKHTYKFLEISA
jgi:hypothetical protein